GSYTPNPGFYVTDGVFPEFRLVRATGTYPADGTIATTGLFVPFWSAAIVTYKGADQTTHFRVTASVSSPQPGVPFSVTVTARDAPNPPPTAYTGTVHLSSSDAAAGLPLDFPFTAQDAGTHTFDNVVLHTAGSQTVTATDTNPAAGFAASTP